MRGSFAFILQSLGIEGTNSVHPDITYAEQVHNLKLGQAVDAANAMPREY